MCQLLGMNANTPTDVMFSFAGLASAPTSTRTASASPSSRTAACAPSSTTTARASRPWPNWSSATRSAAATSSPTSARPRRVGGAGEHAPLRARAVGPLLGVRPQRRPEGLCAAAARRLPPGGRHRQRARVLLADAGTGQGPRQRAERRRADAARCANCCRSRPRTAPSTCCCPTARRCGRMQHPAALARARPPLRRATLADEDLSVDFGALTTPNDRVAGGGHRSR
jgi:hypothetical protein